ncbi:Asparaginase [Penicillium ucsense]|uniref:Asparaginase n=1 Tax=Penicillium ucsense TaxID=2839758 RepID=A0A8J8WM92_9EURO|nr:Asparaginase [Penicillium ucsense]KAF7737231.1 Asparaginase [Penicillium ucsense]
MSDSTAKFKPNLVIHGGAGVLQRDKLPPPLYEKHRASLQSYLRSTHALLKDGASALDAAVHAVSLLEDDELFNCGRGSVFTSAGTIEMEASVMVTSVQDPDDSRPGELKKAAAVINVRNVRHPIQLARESLLRTGCTPDGQPRADGGSMHPQLAGPHVESLARDWDLEFMPDEWFWTQRRWDEHRRGLEGKDEPFSLSQGTVGCVCLDQWGNLAVATSTGGKTNKMPGRVGDTPTPGAGFWAEAWDVFSPEEVVLCDEACSATAQAGVSTSGVGCLGSCLSQLKRQCRKRVASITGARPRTRDDPPAYSPRPTEVSAGSVLKLLSDGQTQSSFARRSHRRAIALSGTGDGDAFLRIAAAHSVASLCRLQNLPLARSVQSVAGLHGALQRSAGARWGITGEGEGGFIGIEISTAVPAAGSGSSSSVGRVELETEKGPLYCGQVVLDFNCGGMWRAWIEPGPNGEDVERIMVFREEYK